MDGTLEQSNTTGRLAPVMRSAIMTVFTLMSGMLTGIAVGTVVHAIVPGHMFSLQRIIPAIPFALGGVFAGGVLWSRAIAHIAGVPVTRRLQRAGGVGFGVTFIVVALLLTVLEQTFVEGDLAGVMPIHNLFTLLFTPSAAVVAGISTLALARGAGLDRAWRPALAVGTVAGITFLAVNLTMQSAGWIVGGPQAAERATMLTVFGVGALASALTGGAALGMVLVPRMGNSADQSHSLSA